MSSVMTKTLQDYKRGMLAAVERKQLRVLIPYDGSESAETALKDLERAGLPQTFAALIPVTDVWLPSSPDEINRAVDARRLKLLTSGISSFAPALRTCEEQRVLSREADDRLRSRFPSASVTTQTVDASTSLASEMVEAAENYGAELIVVGSDVSPSSQIMDYALPALSIARSAHCSVRIARASERKAGSPVNIAIGVDETKSTERVVKAVSERLWPAGSNVNIVVIGELKPRDPVRESQMALALDQLADKLRRRGLTVSIAVEYGQRPEDLLLAHAKKISTDCIFLDAGLLGDGQGSHGLSKVAQSVVLGASCSVEIVRPKILSREHLDPAA
ncbi:MAG TPA: universal stress protein [Pyrinomonadaceae bacterium]|nr:universal stress protein [Pyrinomonadaceae bacterium]